MNFTRSLRETVNYTSSPWNIVNYTSTPWERGMGTLKSSRSANALRLRLHTSCKPLPPLCRPTGSPNQIAVRGIMRFPTQQKGADTRIRPRLCGLSRAMTRPPRRRPAPKDSIQDRKGHSRDGRTLFQGGRFRIQRLPLKRIG